MKVNSPIPESFIVTALLLSSLRAAAAPATAGNSIGPPGIPDSKTLYLQNRPPLLPGAFLKLPIGSITPKGWLRRQLELEAEGMTGHLEEISKWCVFDGNAWVSRDGRGENGWEEVPYWLKGYGDLGYVLRDEKIIKAARRWIDGVLSSQEPDGYFGPRENKTGLEGKPDLWPHMVMLNVLQSFQEATGDPRVIPFISRYLKWLYRQPQTYFGNGYWPRIRFGDTIETAYWVYNRTGEAWLLELTKRIHSNMQDWTTGVHNWHNVNIAQGFREPGIYYLQAHDEEYLRAAGRNYDTVMGLYGQFPGGGFAGDENCRPGFTDPRQGFETCGIVEFMHSFEMLTKISGNAAWSDRCEDLAFNSLPAALTPDAKGLHYLTCANQVRLDWDNHAPAINNEGTMFSYSPFEVYRCCQHNVSHGWPYYAEELWLATPDRGLCASLYAAGEVKAQVGDGAMITVTEDTDYPFSDTVRLRIATTGNTTFPLYLRIPGWCEGASVTVNGAKAAPAGGPLAYSKLDREWKDGDVVSLKLPMRINVQRWEKNHNAVSVNYGPLSFSLKIGERWTRYGGTDAWPEKEVAAETPWNYGLVLNRENPETSFHIVKRHESKGLNPFTPETAPIELRTRAKRIPGWQADKSGLVGKLQNSPVESNEATEAVTLIPMGAARLRVSMFPVIGTGKDASEWTAAK